MIPSWMPQVGMKSKCKTNALNIWTSYGGHIGIDVRKNYENKSKLDGAVTTVRYVCSNEGYRTKDKRDHKTRCPRAETRTECKVRMDITLDREVGDYQRNAYSNNRTAEEPRPLASIGGLRSSTYIAGPMRVIGPSMRLFSFFLCQQAQYYIVTKEKTSLLFYIVCKQGPLILRSLGLPHSCSKKACIHLVLTRLLLLGTLESLHQSVVWAFLI